LHLQPDLDDFERIGENDLAAAGGAAGHDLPAPPDGVGLLVGEVGAHEVVDGQLDGLLGRDADHLRDDAGVQAADALVLDDLLRAVDAVLVEALAGAAAALVLHARLHQVDRVHHEGAERARYRAQREVVRRFQRGVQEVLRSRQRLLAHVERLVGSFRSE